MVLPVLAKRVQVADQTAKAEKISFVRRMIAEEFPLDAIARCTELPLSVIEALYNEMKIHA